MMHLVIYLNCAYHQWGLRFWDFFLGGGEVQVVSLIIDELEKGSSILCDSLMGNEDVAVAC